MEEYKLSISINFRKKRKYNEQGRYLPNNLDSNIVCEPKRKMSDGENRGKY
jgi:hypothetical protein